MFERFTDKARMTVILARAKAAERGDQIRPVYMLHALATSEGVAAEALASMGVNPAAVERELERTAPLSHPLAGDPADSDAEALATIGIDLDEIKRKVEENFGPSALERMPLNRTGAARLTRQSKKSLELALRQAVAGALLPAGLAARIPVSSALRAE